VLRVGHVSMVSCASAYTGHAGCQATLPRLCVTLGNANNRCETVLTIPPTIPVYGTGKTHWCCGSPLTMRGGRRPPNPTPAQTENEAAQVAPSANLWADCGIERLREIVKLGQPYSRLAACIWDFLRSLARSSAER
jgi:hypothetical protein